MSKQFPKNTWQGREFGSHDFDGLLENHDFVLLVNLGVMQDFNSPPNEAQPVISPHITQCNKMPKRPILIAVSDALSTYIGT